jgi:two-component system cell cycle response regulator
MPECDVSVAANVAERMRRLVSDNPFNAGEGEDITVTVSIGIACRQGDDDTPDKLLARADEALYEAKRNGRNRVEVQPDTTVVSEKAASG